MKHIVAVGDTAILVADTKREARKIAMNYRDNGRFATIWPLKRAGCSDSMPCRVYDSAREQGLI